jgi:hypothetical protein
MHCLLCEAESAWNSPYFAAGLIVFAFACCIFWLFRIPSPGKAVTAMAVAAAVMTLRGEIGGFEKFCWLTLLFIFLIVEIRAIDKDRQEHEEKFRTTLQGFETTIAGITGGKTFPYLEVPGEQKPLGVVSLCKEGTDPLYEVTLELSVTTPLGGGASTGRTILEVSLGNIRAGARPHFETIQLSSFDLKDKESVDICAAFEARNGSWHQIMYLRRIGGWGPESRWLKASKVFRVEYGSEGRKQAKRVLVLDDVPEDFPLQGATWDDSLLYQIKPPLVL